VKTVCLLVDVSAQLLEGHEVPVHLATTDVVPAEAWDDCFAGAVQQWAAQQDWDTADAVEPPGLLQAHGLDVLGVDLNGASAIFAGLHCNAHGAKHVADDERV
jgi:hypothetical protein